MSLISEIQQAQDEIREGWVACPACHGTGQDTEHTWPDGRPAACESCQGYGENPKPTPEEPPLKWDTSKTLVQCQCARCQLAALTNPSEVQWIPQSTNDKL